MALTLEDVARLSGVSRSTVSRVINGDPNVNESTRRKVLEIVQELHFQPNLAARRLAAGHTRVIGLVIPRQVSTIFADPYFPKLIKGISSACNQQEYSVMLWLAEPDYERRALSQILYNGLVDGVIVASPLSDDSIITSLMKKKVPFVMNGRHPTLHTVNYIDVDNRTAARDAVRHLLRLGRQRIATITGPRSMVSGLDRYEGYLDALSEAGLPYDRRLVWEGDYGDESGYRGMQRLLPYKPDALFAHSDVMAVGAMRALHEAGLRVPQDIAVVGFDDLPFAAHSEPPLTTVRQPIERSGGLAAEMLIDIIHHPEIQPRRLILPTELVIRASCGAIPPES